MNDWGANECGEWPAVTVYRVVAIAEGKKRYYYSAGSTEAIKKMRELLKKNIPAWIEERSVQDELDDIPF